MALEVLGEWLDLMILEYFSSLNESVIHYCCRVYLKVHIYVKKPTPLSLLANLKICSVNYGPGAPQNAHNDQNHFALFKRSFQIFTVLIIRKLPVISSPNLFMAGLDPFALQ